MVARPHGGRLVNRVATEARRERILAETPEIPQIQIDSDRAVEAENIARGIYSPLEGFMLSEDFESCLARMRLSNDVPWTLPIVLDVQEGQLVDISEGDEVLLTLDGSPIALMEVEEIYRYNKRQTALAVFGTESPEHPGVRRTYEMGDLLVGGRITLVGSVPNPYERYTLWPI